MQRRRGGPPPRLGGRKSPKDGAKPSGKPPLPKGVSKPFFLGRFFSHLRPPYSFLGPRVSLPFFVKFRSFLTFGSPAPPTPLSRSGPGEPRPRAGGGIDGAADPNPTPRGRRESPGGPPGPRPVWGRPRPLSKPLLGGPRPPGKTRGQTSPGDPFRGRAKTPKGRLSWVGLLNPPGPGRSAGQGDGPPPFFPRGAPAQPPRVRRPQTGGALPSQGGWGGRCGGRGPWGENHGGGGQKARSPPGNPEKKVGGNPKRKNGKGKNHCHP